MATGPDDPPQWRTISRDAHLRESPSISYNEPHRGHHGLPRGRTKRKPSMPGTTRG